MMEARIVELEKELTAARAEVRRYQKIVEAGDDVISLISAEKVTTFITREALEAATGIPAEVHQGTNAFAWIHPDDRPALERRFEELVAAGLGARARAEYRHTHANGGWIWVEVVVCNLLDDPDVRGLVAISRTIDDAVRVREDLRAANERYEIAMRMSREAVWERNLRDDTMVFSPAVCALLGYEMDELPSTVSTTRTFLHPDDVVVQEELVAAGLRGERLPDSETRVLHKSGEYRWARINREIHWDGEGQPLRLIAHITDVHERKVAEARLRDSERRYRALFEGTTVAVTVRDSRDQSFIDCNDAALKLYGMATREEFRVTDPADLSPPFQPDGTPSHEAARKMAARAVTEGSARSEWLARQRSGETCMLDLRVSVIDLDDGRRIMQTLVEDVSERKRSERALHERSRREALVGRVSRLLVEGASHALEAALGEIGTHFRCARASVRRVRSSGVTETLAVWAADDSPRPASDPARSVDGEAVAASVIEHLRFDGWLIASDLEESPVIRKDLRESERFASPVSLVLPLVDQRVVVGWIALDPFDGPCEWRQEEVTVARLLAEILSIGHARAEAEARTRLAATRDELIGEISRRFLDEDPERALDAALERVGTTLDFERVSVFAPDAEGVRLTCTHRWHAPGAEIGWESLESYPVPLGAFDHLAVTSEPLADRPQNGRIDDWLSTLQRESGARTLQAPIGYGGRAFGLLVARLRPSRRVSRDDVATLESVGEVVAVARVRRAAELALAEGKEAAVAASAAKSSFLANISHELRTPLNGVIGMVDLLAGTGLDERQRQFCDVAASSATALLSVINDVLDFSKIEANKLELDSAPFDLTQLVGEVVEMLALQADHHGLELAAETDPSIGRVLGDAARIRQILVNLVNNAIKFTPSGSVIVRSRLARESERELSVRVEVEDTGVGLAPDAERRLFKPFSQLDDTPARKQGGTGLGLAISRDLVERMGGTIGVHSQAGRGSTFWFELPLSRDVLSVASGPLGRPDAARVAPAPRPLAGARVLVVEDSAVNALVTTELLRRAGAVYELAEDGMRAIEAARKSSFDIVLMDCHLPDMDGYETTRRLRALGLRAPIVALTAGATTEDLARCFASGMNDRVVKPVDATRFVDLVARHLAHHAAPAPTTSRVFDSAGALERMRGDRDLFLRVCSRFKEIAPGERRALAAAVMARDDQSVAALGHRLRGQAGTFGAHALTESLSTLEAAARESRWASASAALLVVEGELDRLLLALANPDPA